MRKIILFGFLLFSSLTFAQVGVGTENPESSAMFQVESSNKGVLITRVPLIGTNDTTTIASPTEGLLIYNTATANSGSTAVSPGFYYYNGTEWKRLLNKGNVVSNTASITANTLAISNLPGAVFTGNTTVASNIYTTTQDFVFGSSSLDDVSGDSDDARFFFDKSKAAFRAGLGYRSDWDEENIGDYSIVLGDGLASGKGAMAFGGSNIVTSNNAIALGGLNVVKGDISTAIGFGLQTNSFSELVVGSYNIELDPDEIEIDTWRELDPIFTVGNGESWINTSNAFQILKNGDATFNDNLTINKDLFVEGDFSTDGDIDIGGSVSAGTFVGDGSGLTGIDIPQSVFTGKATITSNVYTATQDFVFGSSSLDNVSGTLDDTRFFFDKSKGAFRAGTTRVETTGNEEVWDEEIVGEYSAAFGVANEASGLVSTAFGLQNTASSYLEFVVGANNIILDPDDIKIDDWQELDPLFTVGNGSSLSNKSNAFQILKNGDATFYDNLKVKKDIDVEGGIDVTGTITATTFVGDGSRLTGTVADGSITNPKISSSAAIDFTKLNISKTNIVGLGIPSEDTDTTYSAGEGLRLEGTSFSVNSNVVTSTYTGDVGITGTVSATAFVGDGSRLTGTVADGSITNPKISSSAAIDFTKLNISKTNIVGLGIPSEDTDTTYSAGEGLRLEGTSFSVNSNVVTSTYTGDVGVTGTVSATAFVGDGSRLTGISGGSNVFTGNATITSNVYSATQDFVFGSSSLDNVSGTSDDDARFFFDKSKGAFRAGISGFNEWDSENIGLYSIALGNNNTASGYSAIALGALTKALGMQSTAMGNMSIAEGDFSTAMGSGTKASGNYSTAMGSSTVATGDYSIAMGWSTEALGDYSTTMGYNTKASGNYSTAMGSSTVASRDYSTAMGSGTKASGAFSTAMGSDTKASGTYSIASGYSSTASGTFSIAMGNNTEATGQSSIAIGENTKSSGAFSVSLGNATEASGESSFAMGYSTTASATSSIAMGYETEASGTFSIAMGNNTEASGQSATAMGDSTKASSAFSTAMGSGTKASGAFSTAMGSDTKASGTYSIAMGYSTTASATSSIAMGYETEASGTFSIAMGNNTEASGQSATAMGDSTKASSAFSTAMGSGTKASGAFSTAMGSDTKASGTYSIAMGYSTTASATSSIAMGYETEASGTFSIAMGNSTEATGQSSIAMGENTEASGDYSTAMGSSSEASGDYSTAMGDNTEASGESSTAMGSSSEALGGYSTAMGYDTEASGEYSTVMGWSTEASGDYSTAMGNLTKAIGESSIAMGYSSTASGTTSTAMGYDTEASGDYSTAMGDNTVASGDYSTAMGNLTKAIGESSIAMGYSSTASGTTSTAMGFRTEASGTISTAMGSNTKATGYNSLAMGFLNEASGDYSTAMGNLNNVNGYNATVIGTGLVNEYDNSIILGRYNEPISEEYISSGDQPLLIIGNGQDKDNKSNAFQILKNGDATFYEDLEVIGSLTESSDIRLKKNIVNISNATETINKLSPKRYRKKTQLTSEEYSIEEMGFIAQDIEKILPFLVKKDNSVDEILSLNYTSFIALLTKGFQEQSAKMEAQTTMLNQLEERLKSIEKLLNENQP